MDSKVFYAGNIDDNTVLYRYMSLNQFISFVELGRVYLTKITKWEDSWEAPLRQVPRMFSDGKLVTPSFTLEDSLYGQCWSKQKDSDALWRIYCNKNNGIMIQSSAKKFNLMKDFKRAYLGEIKYYKRDKLMEAAKELAIDKTYAHCESAFLKRDSFNHESEVRIIVCQQDHTDKFESGCNYIYFDIDVINFIEGIYIDPRSDDWFVESIVKYSQSKGLNTLPLKSELYLPNISDHNKFCITYEPVE